MAPALFIVAVMLCGCASPKFTEYHGLDVIQGKGGGALRIVDGVDFWESGDASRKYQILGVIELSRGRVPLPGRIGRLFSDSGGHDSDDHDSAIAKAAHEKGGDAVIIIGAGQQPSVMDEDDGQRQRRSTKFVVVRYVE